MTNPIHFTLEEFLHSDTAKANGIENTPTWDVVDNLRRLGGLMDQIRGGGGGNPVTILSGYRCPEVNALVGGATNSAHLYGLACDFVIPAYGSPRDICLAIEPHMAFLQIDQLILEFDDWVHLGLAEVGASPRCQCLTINNAGTCEGF
jgi:hypothetical protein